MEHETNTFSPVATPWDSFGPEGPFIGQDVVTAMTGTKTPIGAFLDIAKKEKAEIITPISGLALPSGPVDLSAYNRFCDLICNEVAKGCDAVFLDLHGAMVVKNGPLDGEGVLLKKLRDIDPLVPIAVSLDLHANVTPLMVHNCNVMSGYKTYPHIDMYETGYLAGSILVDSLKGNVNPVMAWQSTPILAHTLKMDTKKGAMKAYAMRAKNAEGGDVLSASAFGGFPMADIPDAGMSVVVVTNGRKKLAESTCKNILQGAWENREDFIWSDVPLVDAIKQAKTINEGPVLLIDHADNCASGGTQDTMHVLKEALKQGLNDIAVGPIKDPGAVEIMSKIGIGGKVSLDIGGKLDMPAINKMGEPLRLKGRVKNITDGKYVVTGPQFTGMTMHMGKTAVLETSEAEIVVTEKLQEPLDIGVFTSVGIDPAKKHYLLLKSRMYFQPVFGPIAKEVIYCNGVGVTSSDWNLFQYRNVRRPIYPLDTFE